jgi:hypothetical protein
VGIVRTQESLDSLLVLRGHKKADGILTSEKDFCKFEEKERLFWKASWELSITRGCVGSLFVHCREQRRPKEYQRS